MARQGLNVVIMSRSEEKLQKVADEISELVSMEIYMIPYNFKGTAMTLFSIRVHSSVPLSDIWHMYNYSCGGTKDCHVTN